MELLEILGAINGATKRKGSVDGRDESNGDGPDGVEEDGKECVGVCFDATDAFQDVETVTLVEPNYNEQRVKKGTGKLEWGLTERNSEERDPEPDHEVYDDIAPPPCPGWIHYDRSHVDDVV